ncbi:MAG: glutathione S-transferase N-terminal domain-containing protein [Rhodospirillales bacterium]
MKLRYSPTSPYVRKVSITAIEAGLADKIENVSTDPWSAETDLGQSNPIGKVPCLTTDAGDPIYDSPVICEYLDSLNNGPKLFPEGADARFKALTLAATGDGMLDAGVLLLIETVRRPAELKWDWWAERQASVVNRCMDVADAAADGMATTGGPITIAEISIGAGLGWIDLRFPDFGWRKERPALADWFDKISERPSFEQTVPKPA